MAAAAPQFPPHRRDCGALATRGLIARLKTTAVLDSVLKRKGLLATVSEWDAATAQFD